MQRPYRDDYIILKIKVQFFRYIKDIIKKNSIEGNINLKKLPYNSISDLQRERNITLLNMKIKNILSETPIKINSRKIYAKITIKSLIKKNKDNSTLNVNDLNEDINLEKEKREIPVETNIKNEEANNFSKTLNKNIYLNLKKENRTNTEKKNFNKSSKKRNKRNRKNFFPKIILRNIY